MNEIRPCSVCGALTNGVAYYEGWPPVSVCSEHEREIHVEMAKHFGATDDEAEAWADHVEAHPLFDRYMN